MVSYLSPDIILETSNLVPAGSVFSIGSTVILYSEFSITEAPSVVVSWF